MLAVARFTLAEALRKRLVLAVAVLTLAYLALYGLGLHLYAHSETSGGGGLGALQRSAEGAALVVVGMYLGRMLAALLVIFVASGAVAAEVESGILHSVLARPVRRSSVLLGKYAGLGAMVVVYSAALNLSVVLLAGWFLHTAVSHPVAVIALACLEPLLLLALALLGSSLLPTLACGAAVLMLYGLSIVGGILEQMAHFVGSATLAGIGIATSLVIPADAIYRKAAALSAAGTAGAFFRQFAGPFGSYTEPSGWMIVYAVVYLIGAVAAAAAVLARRDL